MYPDESLSIGARPYKLCYKNIGIKCCSTFLLSSVLINVFSFFVSLVRVAHSGMTTDEIVENIATAVGTVSTKLHLVSWGFLDQAPVSVA